MSKPKRRSNNDKADAALAQKPQDARTGGRKQIKPSSPNLKISAIQRQLERESKRHASTPKQQTETVSKTLEPTQATQEVNETLRHAPLLRKVGFTVITLFFCSLTFWLGMQFSDRPGSAASVANITEQNTPPQLAAEAATTGTVSAEEEIVSPTVEQNLPRATLDNKELLATGFTGQMDAAPAPIAHSELIENKITSAPLPNTKSESPELLAPPTNINATQADTKVITAIATEASTTTAQALPARALPEKAAIEKAEITKTLPVNTSKPETTNKDSLLAASATAIAANAAVAKKSPDTNPATSASGTSIKTVSEPSSKTETKSSALPAAAIPVIANNPVPVESALSSKPGITTEDKTSPPEQVADTEAISPELINSMLADYGKQVNYIIQSNINYPKRAILLRQQGKVVFEIVIDRNGNIIEKTILEDPGHRLLVQAAMRGISKSINLPPVPAAYPKENIHLSIPITFKLP